MRSYEVMVGPIMANTDEGLEVVVPAYRVKTVGVRVKYAQDYFQILDRHDVIVFAVPHSLVMWCREVRTGNEVGEIFVFAPEEEDAAVVESAPSVVDSGEAAVATVDESDEPG
jgi:hypothetical protein